MSINELTKISLFDGAKIRKTMFKNEWYFSVVDICAVLSESSDPNAY